MSEQASPANGANVANGTNGTNDTANVSSTNGKAEIQKFSWLSPHPIFVIILVGPEELPFGIQKDYLCARSGYYRKFFEENKEEAVKLENVVKLEGATTGVFGLVQNYLYTGALITNPNDLPSYETLVGLWKLGHKLEIDGICDKVLEAMLECRRTTQRIPATPLLIQVWKDTPEGSSIRTLLLSWAAEYMRFSESRAEFAKSLPQEVLSELVVTMSSFDSPPIVEAPVDSPTVDSHGALRKNVHYLEDRADEDMVGGAKRPRHSTGSIQAGDQAALGRKAFRPTLAKIQKRRASGVQLDPRAISKEQKLEFCADLLARMLSGPGTYKEAFYDDAGTTMERCMAVNLTTMMG
jgi:hypothetical protein